MNEDQRSLRIYRNIDTTADWYKNLCQEAHKRLGSTIEFTENPTVTILGRDEFATIRKKYTYLGRMAVSQLYQRLEEFEPFSLSTKLSAQTKELYVRPVPDWSDGVQKIALSFCGAAVLAERDKVTNSINYIVGTNIKWFRPYSPNLSFANITDPNISEEDILLDALHQYVPKAIDLLPGDIEIT